MNSDTIGGGSPFPSATFSDLRLFDYLRQDARPIFAVNVSSNLDKLDPGLKTVFTNEAFQKLGAAPSSNGRYSSLLSLASLNAPADEQTSSFISWVKGTSNIEFWHGDYIWSPVTIEQEWRIISGNRTRNSGESSSLFKPNVVSESHPEPFDRQVVNHTNSNTAAVSFDDAAENQIAHELLSSAVYGFHTTLSDHCRLVQNFNWMDTSLGPIRSWSRALLQAVSFLLCNNEPAVIFWGPERTMLYNESYVSLIGGLHPAALGASANVVFDLFWATFEKICLQIQRTGQPVKGEAQRVILDRARGIEETFFTYTFSPLFEADGSVNGILSQPLEVTNQVVAQRQMTTLIRIGEDTSQTTVLEDYWASLFESIHKCTADLPFVAVYSTDTNLLMSGSVEDRSSRTSKTASNDKWYLEGSIGFPTNHPAIPQVLEATGSSGCAPVLKLVDSNEPFLVNKSDGSLPEEFFVGCTDSGAGTSFSQVVLCPMSFTTGRNAAWLILGVNSLRPYSNEYEQFIHLLSRQIEDSATSVILLQKETRRLQTTMNQAEHQRLWLSEQLRQQTREAQESDLRFYNFAKQAPVGVYILGPTGEIKFCNDAWYKLVGVPIGFQGPVPWRVHVHPDDLEATDRQWQSLLQGNSQTNFEWRAVRSSHTSDEDGVVYLRSSCFPELAEDGSMKTVTGVLMDVSIHKAHERAASDRLTSALEAKRAQENFMDMVSHEMRNPLNAMLQCAEEASQLTRSLTKQGVVDQTKLDTLETVLEAIDTIQYCGRHQKQIIDDVLTISKLDSNLLTLSPMEVAPVNIVEQALKIFASEIRASQIHVSQDTSSDTSRTPYLMDPSRVLQILINLVGNAIKFLNGRPTRHLHLAITTSAERPVSTGVTYVPSGRQQRRLAAPVDWGSGDAMYIGFRVTDTGPGLTQEEMDTLFARFKQASPRTHAQYGGSGLGLFISRELAELHGGEIGLESRVQEGSTFAFYINARTIVSQDKSCDNDAQQHQKPNLSRSQSIVPSLPSTESAPSPSSITVLIVEDNLINQNVLNRQLKRIGFKTITANHGGEALTAIRGSRWCQDHNAEAASPSVVLCDLEMPVLDGLSCVREVRKWQRSGVLRGHIPMVAVTGNARSEQLNTAKEAGFDDVVCKPYSVKDLVPLINKLVQAKYDGA